MTDKPLDPFKITAGVHTLTVGRILEVSYHPTFATAKTEAMGYARHGFWFFHADGTSDFFPPHSIVYLNVAEVK